MKRGHRTAFLIGCAGILLLAGPASLTEVGRGVRGPYDGEAGLSVFAEELAETAVADLEPARYETR